MAFTITKPVETPTGLSATLQSGGSLAASTTYYYVVIGFNDTYTTPSLSSRRPFHSDISEEGTFTTDATNRSVLIQWTNATGASNYNVLLTTTSGDYTNSGMYGVAAENVGSYTDGTTGITITSLSTSTYIHHSCQLVNNLIGGLDKNLGTVRVDFTDGTYSDASQPLNTIYDAMVNSSPSFEDYVFWDGQNFVLKGWITTSGTSSGSVTIYDKTLTFIKGGVDLDNPNFTFQFGDWTSDDRQASYKLGCTINLQHSRYPFRSYDDSNLKVYGCMLRGVTSLPEIETENLDDSYYHGGAQLYFTGKIDEIKDSMLGVGVRGITSAINDLKIEIGNNFSNGDHVRCKFENVRSAAYTDGANLYDCTFMVGNSTSSALRMYVPAAGTTFSSHYYDNTFLVTENNDNIPWVVYSTNYGNTTSDSSFNFYYQPTIKVIDEEGQPISGVTVNCVDKDGSAATWIEHDGTGDRKITGTTYTTGRTTDSDGMVDTYYLKSHVTNLAPDNTEAESYCDNIVRTFSYPYTFTFSKSGYQDYSITIDDFNEPVSMIVKYTENGEVPTSSMFKHITHKKINGIAP